MTPGNIDASWPLLTVAIRQEYDVVAARQRARHIAQLLGFDHQDQVRLATAVSEIARNAFQYGGGGKAEFLVDAHAAPPLLQVRVSDRGRGIPHLDEILAGRYRSETGMGLGIAGTRRLVDEFRVDTAPGSGTTVLMGKRLPRLAAPPTAVRLRQLTDQLALERPQDAYAELQQQNRELLQALDELRQRQAELARLNQELEETNRGVVALYAELDDRAASLRRADEVKSRFLSHMSHEFRTPLNSILALAGLLLERADGDLTVEQERQVGYIRRSAQELFEMVNDLLDLAKVEAGKTTVRLEEFSVYKLFGTLRAMFRPLQSNDSVSLVFDEPATPIHVYSDEGKVAQILRNFISNALKFTEKGEVRVCARLLGGKEVQFTVADTGIGIRPEDRETIFQEFAQVESPLQRRVRGTGLGLPLSKKFAELLGGSITVESEPGAGSTFYFTLPLRLPDMAEESPSDQTVDRPAGASESVLIIDDEETARYVSRQLFRHLPYRIVEAVNGIEGLERVREQHPRLVLLDLNMPEMDGFAVLDVLRADPGTRDIPVLIHTSRVLTPAEEKKLRDQGAGVLSKKILDPEGARSAIARALDSTPHPAAE